LTLDWLFWSSSDSQESPKITNSGHDRSPIDQNFGPNDGSTEKESFEPFSSQAMAYGLETSNTLKI
jgi:hypothetical protein